MSALIARVFASIVVLVPASVGQTNERVSVSSTGQEANGTSSQPKISPDGRFVCFSSGASNLVAGDTNGTGDIFLRDRLAGTTTRVSVSSTGIEGNGQSWLPSMSADGRYIAFGSSASNLVIGDNNGTFDFFVRDVLAGTTEMVSVQPSGALFNSGLVASSLSLSANGRFATFLAGSGPSLHRRDRLTGLTQWFQWGGSQDTSVSSDGRFVAIVGPSFSPVFVQSTVFFLDTLTPPAIQIAFPALNHIAWEAVISADGRFTAYRSNGTLVPGDTNATDDIYLFDRTFSSTIRVSVPTGGSQSNGLSDRPGISDNGRFIVFSSEATNLDPLDVDANRDIYLHDSASHTTSLVSSGLGGVPADNTSYLTDVSDDGRFVVFSSHATNLIVGDTNGATDIFVRDMGFAPPSTYCVAKVNSQGCTPAIGWTGTPSVSSPDDFHVTALQVRNASPGIMFWGTAPAAVPFAGGTRCVQAPLIRTDVSYSGGAAFPTADCSGTYDFHFSHAYMASFFLATGTTVHAQFWQRDSIHPDGTGQGLTDGLRFTITP